MFEIIILVLLFPIAVILAAYIGVFDVVNNIFDFLDKLGKQSEKAKEDKSDSQNDRN